jgi:hypothetical protein
MIKKLTDKYEIEKCQIIEKGICYTPFLLLEFTKKQDFKEMFCFPETFLLKFDLFQIIKLNFEAENNKIYLSSHKNNEVVFFEIVNLNESEWNAFFQSNNSFVNILYSDFTYIFDDTQKWFYFHKIDYPNILFSKNTWTITKKHKKFIVPKTYALEEFICF